MGKKKEKTLKDLLAELKDAIEKDDDGTVSVEEYILISLRTSGKLDDDTEELYREQFAALDADGSGELDEDDVVMLTKLCDEMHIE